MKVEKIYRFCDENIKDIIVKPESETIQPSIVICLHEDWDHVELSKSDLEALANAMGKSLVDIVSVHDVEEYYKDDPCDEQPENNMINGGRG